MAGESKGVLECSPGTAAQLMWQRRHQPINQVDIIHHTPRAPAVLCVVREPADTAAPARRGQGKLVSCSRSHMHPAETQAEEVT